MINRKMTLFIQTPMQKQLLMKATLIMYLNQSIQQLYQTWKIFIVKGSGWITDLVIDHYINI